MLQEVKAILPNEILTSNSLSFCLISGLFFAGKDFGKAMYQEGHAATTHEREHYYYIQTFYFIFKSSSTVTITRSNSVKKKKRRRKKNRED